MKEPTPVEPSVESDCRTINLEGRTYSWTGRRWVDIDTFKSPPAITAKKLDGILLLRLKEEDEKATDLHQLLDRARDAKTQKQFSRDTVTRFQSA